MPPARWPWHATQAVSAGGEGCWLLLDQKLPRGIGGFLDKLGPYFHYDERAEVWYLDGVTAPFLMMYLDQRYGPRWCIPCQKGKPCDVWNINRLIEEGYELPSSGRKRRQRRAFVEIAVVDDRAKAAEILGLTSGASKAEIQTAFRALALKAHPDQGGSDQQMRSLLEARDILLAR